MPKTKEEKKEAYKFIDDITSDVLFEAYGADLKELFQNAATALSSVMCQIEKIEPKEKRAVELKADNVEDLMFNWLEEIVGLVDTEQLFFSKFDVKEIDEKHLKAEISGEPTSPEKGETVVKSVTYYKFAVEKTPKGWLARVSLDI